MNQTTQTNRSASSIPPGIAELIERDFRNTNASGENAEYCIYVADLRRYNEGYLNGRWIDAAQDPADIQAEVDEMLAEHNGEEWAIHDYELGGVRISESEGFESVSAIAEFLSTWGEDWGPALLSYCDNDLDRATKRAEEGYAGEYRDPGDFAEELYGDEIDVPANIAPYIDWGAFERDMKLNGDIFTLPAGGGSVYVFYEG